MDLTETQTTHVIRVGNTDYPLYDALNEMPCAIVDPEFGESAGTVWALVSIGPWVVAIPDTWLVAVS